MANEGASSSNIPADSTGSDSHNESTSEIHSNNTISEDISGIGGSDELQKKSPGEQSLDAEFPTPGDYLSECPDCCYPRRTGSPLRPGSPQHTEYCLNIFVRQGNETSSTDNRQEHISELQEILRRSTDTLSSGTWIDSSLSTPAVDPSVLTIPTAILADTSEHTTGESHGTDEPELDSSSTQSPLLPHDTDNQPQPAMESVRHISNDVVSLDEPRNHSSKCPTCQKDFTRCRPDSFKRHISEAHVLGAYPCPHPECTKFWKPFKRPDKLQNHLKKCKYELKGTDSPS